MKINSDMENKRLTIQSNKITLGRTNFTLMQKRVVLAIVESISPHLRNSIYKEPGREVNFQPLIYDGMCKITYKASDLGFEKIIFKDIETALNGLLDSRINLKTVSGYLSTRYLLNWKFEKNTSRFEFTIDKEVYQLFNEQITD